MIDYLDSYFNLSSDEVTISISNEYIRQGKVEVNQATIPSYPFNLHTYKNFEMDIKALPAKGYRFSYWEYANQVLSQDIVSNESRWKYLDEASDYPVDWTDISFDDAAWDSGYAELGYGDDDENTLISYGGDAGNKIPTALFRKKIHVADTSGITALNLSVNADDGAVVYLNGQEVFRVNMNAGSVHFSDYAAGTVQNENTFIYIEIDKNMLLEGDNIIACEVHQASPTSSDLSFDLSLSYTFTKEVPEGIFSKEPLIHSDTSYTISLKPVFEPINNILEGIYLNEIAAVSGSFRDEWDEKSGYIELYNSNNEDVYLVSCFVSDKKDWLTRFAIPDSTLIPAKGLLVVYADGEYLDGPLHTPFKADNDGESVIFSQQAGETMYIHDSITFSRLVEDYSYGKYEDGTGDWLHMEVITPGYPNDSTELEIISNSPVMLTQEITIYPNPVSEYLHISTDDIDFTGNEYYMEILDLSGRKIMPKMWLNSNSTTINTANIRSGLYIIKILRKNHLLYTTKLIKVR